MKPEFILLTIVGGFLCSLIIFLVVFYKPVITKTLVPTAENTKQEAVSTDRDELNSLKSKIESLEKQVGLFKNSKTATATSIAKNKTTVVGKSILATASVQGSIFTTTSATYTPMGMFVNISCPKKCLLWIDFYSSSKNLGPISGAQGNLNSYNLYLNGVDKSIFSQASLTTAEMAAPISLNALLPVSAGTHTIEIKTKTTGGTLQSDSSFLQVAGFEN